MSLPPRVLCRTGCGDVGDPELDFLCGDCYGDKIEIDKQRALIAYIASKLKPKGDEATTDAADEVGVADSLPQRRGPPKVDHRKAFEDFLLRPREAGDTIIARECLFLERELAIRDTSKLQLRRFMIATDLDELVDPKEWGRYQYGAPRDVPRHDVDHATESAAQIKLFCHWRRRTLARRITTRKQLNDQMREADAQAQKALKRRQRKTTLASLVPKLPMAQSVKKTPSAKVLSVAGNETAPGDDNGTTKPAPGSP
jgi:hypothetical protein